MTTGWRQAAGLDSIVARDAKTQEEMGVLADYISEQAYGHWFHNAGIVSSHDDDRMLYSQLTHVRQILFAVLVTRFFTVTGLGWGWIILLLAACASYYTLSIAPTRHRARDDIQRELVKTRLVTETESAEWLNGFLDRFWLM